MTEKEAIAETIAAHDLLLKKLWCIAFEEGQKAEREAFKVYVNQVVADREMAVHDAVLAEREACAKVCDKVSLRFFKDRDDLEQFGADECAAAIRARGE